MLRCEYEAQQKGVSQSAIADACGVRPPNVNAVFRGRVYPYPRLMAGIAKALDWQEAPELLFEEIDACETDLDVGGANAKC